MDEVVVGLDLGTSKVCCVIAARGQDGRLAVVGVGKAKSEGVRAGVIVNIRAAVKSIQAAIEAAETSGWEVKEVIAGLGGGSVEGMNSRGVVAVSGQKEIRAEDVERVLDAAKARTIPMDREILHVLPQEYIVDDARKIKNPVEMMGIRLEAEIHIVTATTAVSHNLIQSINAAGVGVSEVVLNALSSAQAVLSREEKEVGVLLIEIGAGTTNAVLFFEGAPHFSKVYQFGSERVTKDVAQVLQIPDEEAERLKVKSGCAWVEGLVEDTEVIIRGVGSRPTYTLQRSQIARIIQARMEEILSMVAKDTARTGLIPQLGAGIVFTGGGAHLEGLPELAKSVFGKPGRMGVPMGLAGLDESWQRPEYSSVVGLALWGEDRLPDVAVAGVDAEGPRSSGRVASPRKSRSPSKIWEFIKKNFI
jgi:cell division protein FtsA